MLYAACADGILILKAEGCRMRKRLFPKLTVRQSAIACCIVLCAMFAMETITLRFFEKDTTPFRILMGCVIACPFIFVVFLQSVWAKTDSKEPEERVLIQRSGKHGRK